MVAEAMRLIWEQSQGPMTVDICRGNCPSRGGRWSGVFGPPSVTAFTTKSSVAAWSAPNGCWSATELSLKEVASAAGFLSADNLGRTFRRAEGTTPLKYRRRHCR